MCRITPNITEQSSYGIAPRATREERARRPRMCEALRHY